MEKYCRLCLAKIHQQYEISPEFPLLVDLSLNFLGVKLNSILPAFVCKRCETKLFKFHEFHAEVGYCQEILLYDLPRPNLVNITDCSVDETTEEMEMDPLEMSEVAGSNLRSVLLTDSFESVEEPSQPEPMTFTCDICGAQLLSKGSIRAHMVQHIPQTTPLTCELCPYKTETFKSILELRRHKRYQHPIPMPRKKYARTCDVCYRSFSNQNLLNSHKMYGHAIQKGVRCGICKKFYCNKKGLASHVKRMHPYGKMKHKCEICKKTFGSKEQLSDHQKVHTEEGYLLCMWCLKIFSDSSSFTTHRTEKHEVEYLKLLKENHK